MTNRALMATTRLSLFCIAGRHFFGSALLMSNGFGVRLLHLHNRAVIEAFMGVSRRGIKVDTPTPRIILRNRGMSKSITHAPRSLGAEAVERRSWKEAEQLRGMPSVSDQLMVENENAKAMDTGDGGSGTRRTTELREAQRSSSTEKNKPRNKRYSNVSKRQIVIPQGEWPRYPRFSFDVETECKEGTAARTGLLKTPHGDVQTPAFIFCATKAAIKGLSAETMKECGSQIILSNTYHLYVQPGGEAIQKMGGLQDCTRWQGPMLTDSGGYQIFSMGHGSVGDEIKGRRGAEGGAQFDPTLVSIGEKGARFRSYYDCSIKSLTPEKSIEIQRQLGADLIVVLDECTPFHVEREYTESSMHRTHRWALRSLREFIDHDDGSQALYGIVQGGVFPDLRKEAVAFVNKQPFFGIAIGGSLGADKATMHSVVKDTMKGVRRDRPVHLLGIGGISDIFHGVRQGIDTFDCVHPTRLGRHGGALVKAKFWEEDAADQEEEEGRTANKKARQRQRPREHVDLMKGRYRFDNRPIDKDCGCPTCKAGYSRAYIQHLAKAGELLAGLLVSQHNVYFMNELMTAIRRAIREGSLHEEEKKWLAPGLRSWESQKPEAFVSVAGPGDAEIARINEAHGARVNRAGAARVSGAGGACINGAKGALVSGQV